MTIELTVELHELIRTGILENTFIIMTKHSPQDQLIAGGKLSLVSEIAAGVQDRKFRSIMNNPAVIEALEFTRQMRHYDCEFLKARNKKLPSSDDLAKSMLFHKKGDKKFAH